MRDKARFFVVSVFYLSCVGTTEALQQGCPSISRSIPYITYQAFLLVMAQLNPTSKVP